jgi:hypothetical protein
MLGNQPLKAYPPSNATAAITENSSIRGTPHLGIVLGSIHPALNLGLGLLGIDTTLWVLEVSIPIYEPSGNNSSLTEAEGLCVQPWNTH